MAEDAEEKKKPHRKRLAGRKADKKAKKKEKLTGQNKPQNPKAFAFNSAVRAERGFRRTQDIETKKQHIPLVDRTPLEPPPVIVAVVGPPKVGKSTLIQCLIKSFTRQPLTSLKGPVTIVSGRKQRLTLMECNNDINCMIDIAKVADLVLLLVDASFGFEMEVFEFLNICQVHGMPRVMGVLTHLDLLKHSKQLKQVKKTLKHRFWTEVFAGAKLFNLSGMIHGEYLRNEIKNLGRFISVIKFRPLMWRTSHPYVLVDRLEDITSPETIRQNPVADREVCFYGFVRGIPLNKNCSIHIPGCGDFKVKDVAYLPDPCPLPDKEKRRSLIEKEKLIYAPFSGVGGIVYDKDAVYVELAGSHSHSEEKNTSALVTSLMEVQEPLDKKMAHSELKLFSEAEPLTSADVTGNSDRYHEETIFDSGRYRRKVVFKDSLKEDGEEELGGKSIKGEYHESEENMYMSSSSDKDLKESESDEENVDSSRLPENGTNKKYIWQDTEDDNDDNSSPLEEVGIRDSNPQFAGNKISTLDEPNNTAKKRKLSDVNTKLIMEMGGSIDDEVLDDLCSEQVEPVKSKEVLAEKTRIHRKQNNEVRSKISECLALLEKKTSNVNGEKTALFSEDDESDEEEEEDDDGDDDDDDDDDDDNYESNEENDKDYDSYVADDDYEQEHDKKVLVNTAKPKYKNELQGSEDENKFVENSAVHWKSNLAERAASAFMNRQANSFSLWKLVYGQAEKLSGIPEKNENSTEEEDLGGLFRKINKEQKHLQEERDLQDKLDCSKARTSCHKDWSNPSAFESIVDCFVTGKWKESEDAETLLKLDNASVSDESEVFGDFEDLETGEKHTAKNENEKEDEEKETKTDISTSAKKKELIEKKKKLKAKFDAEYDEGEGEFSYYQELKQEVNKQAQLNKSEFEGMDDDLRVQLEGFRAGMYVRIELGQVPCELITNFDATYPLIIGGLLTGEENVGYVQVRIKKHRWYSRILKNCDPIIVSLGWRRFQTIPVFAKLEDNLRHRMLKYTPEHIACMAHFWGPITPQGAGFLALQDVANKEPGFRIAATGSVVELDKSVQVMKKLKLTGIPVKVYKKTAFVRGMFNSALEVAKFEGAKLRTVAGIRGQIKRAMRQPEGAFRATFEDKILISDIVFCRTWYKMEIPKLYNPVSTLLLPKDKKNSWQGMKTLGQLKRERGIRNQAAKDSLYTPIEKEPRVFPPLVIPARLQKMLPYKDKPKKHVAVTSRQKVEKKRIAVVRDAHERKVARLVSELKMSYEWKKKKAKADEAKKKQERKILLEKEEMKMLKRRKELRKQVFRTLDQLEKKKEEKAKVHKKGGKKNK